jgi:hypothetical protein
MDFKDIQPVSPDGQLDEKMPMQTASDLSYIFNNQANAGDQVELFFSIAESRPEQAITFFSSAVRNSTGIPIKSLSIQGFGRIPSPLRQALSSCISQESQDLLKLLCNEIKSRSSDLAVWSAAEALKEIKFSPDNLQHPQGGNLSEPPRRIQNEILDRKIQELSRIRRFDSRGIFTAEYERYLEFWIYGPTSDLFNEKNTDSQYIDVVNDILHSTQIRGIQVGINAGNEKVRQAARKQARLIFENFLNTEEKKTQDLFGNSLKRFLKESNTSDNDLRRLADAICFDFNVAMKPENLEYLTVEEIKKNIASFREYSSEISSIFETAIRMSGEPYLSRFLENEETEYKNSIASWIDLFNEQSKKIVSSSALLKSNFELLIYVLESIRSHDADLYRHISNDKSLGMIKSGSLRSNNQKECEEFLTQLDLARKILSSSLSKKINDFDREYRELNISISKDKEEAQSMLINTGIALAVGVLAPLIVALIVFIVFLFVIGASAGG